MDDLTTPEAIGKRLRTIRELHGMTQVKFAEHIGTTQAGFSQYEAGSRKPSVEIACDLCDAYGLTLDWIYRGDVRGMPIDLMRMLEASSPASSVIQFRKRA